MKPVKKKIELSLLCLVCLMVGVGLGFWFDSGNVVVKTETKTKEVTAQFKYKIGDQVLVKTYGWGGEWKDGEIVALQQDGTYIVSFGNKREVKRADELAAKQPPKTLLEGQDKDD